ncbi:methionyl-tRNA formyltransferase [candidate division WOR-3 bacterium RBG_13_43_14]|uniref:methionyl-tRNA formyltransferase n=1 Tax=candidate division WOR-3 bacterium RBG_13_43_14 TaxID=1802590 RepID=A0A1F4U9U8_UNCW3|nr:MAG: methionyl-tRNA formyltransferase [candidate division WOR-3 bacterium RBG_13_43_14]
MIPENPNDSDFIKNIDSLKPDLFILASYGYILKKDFLSIAPMGGINVHPSLLPKYRGAAPIQRCLMNGDEKTGLTIFFMDEKIDHGEIFFQEEIVIDENDNYGSLSACLTEKARSVIESVLESVINKTCLRRNQEENNKSLAPKIKKEELYIDWQQPARVIHNLVRALAPKPGARTYFRDQEIKILRTSINMQNARPGEIIKINKCMAIGTGRGVLIIERLKPSNRMEMSGWDFINGIRLQQGEVLV